MDPSAHHYRNSPHLHILGNMGNWSTSRLHIIWLGLKPSLVLLSRRCDKATSAIDCPGATRQPELGVSVWACNTPGLTLQSLSHGWMQQPPTLPLVSKWISSDLELPRLGGEQVGLWGALCQSDGTLQAPSPQGLTSQTAKQNTARGSQLHRQSKATRNFQSYLHS